MRNSNRPRTERYVIQFTENVTDQVKLRQMRTAMMHEMQHRIGNLLATIMAIANRTGRTSSDIPSFLEEFEDRLAALMSVSIGLAGEDDGAEDGLMDEGLGKVVLRQILAHAKEAEDQINVDGPNCRLSVMQSQAISLVIHELVSNSLKYGAIKQEVGTITVTWRKAEGGRCVFIWRESRITISRKGDESGYGALLLCDIIPNQLNGVATQKFDGNEFTYRPKFGGTT